MDMGTQAPEVLICPRLEKILRAPVVPPGPAGELIDLHLLVGFREPPSKARIEKEGTERGTKREEKGKGRGREKEEFQILKASTVTGCH